MLSSQRCSQVVGVLGWAGWIFGISLLCKVSFAYRTLQVGSWVVSYLRKG